MRDSRETILSTIRASLGRGPLDAAARERLRAAMTAGRARIIPARARGDHARLAARFAEKARQCMATVSLAESERAAAAEVVRFLVENDLPRAIRMAEDPALDFLALSPPAGLAISRGPAEPADRAVLTRAFAGIAETGTLMLVSGPRHPMTLAFLPEAHIALLDAARIVGSYEEGFDLLRRERAAGETWPRAVTWVTGPSRSADIEQTIQYGAHGPRLLHIVVTEAGTAQVRP